MISDILVEKDPAERQKMIEERVQLVAFMESGPFKTGQSVIDKTYKDAIDVILDFPVEKPGAQGIINQAIGEARTCRDWKLMFTRRLEELNVAIGTLSSDEK